MDWLNTSILFLLSAGNSAIWVAYVNRIHALPWRCSTLHRWRRIHDVMLFLVPVLLLVLLGLTGPKLMLGGRWSSLSTGWWIVVTACGLGCLMLLFTTLRHQFQRLPAVIEQQSRRIVDLVNELGHTPIEPGKYHRLAALSINQQFEVEFNEKTIVFDRLPAVLDGFTILHLSDWHFMGTVSKEFFQRVTKLAAEEPVDLVCFTGDLIDNMQCLEWLSETLGQLDGKFGRYFILGNHDWFLEPQIIRSAVCEQGWIDVASRTVDLSIAGATLQIGGDETPWMGTQPQFNKAADFRLLLCHTPDNFPSAQQNGVDLMLSGHNHGGQVQLPLLGPVYSPSRFGTRFAAGSFWSPPTLMHVSRGLSGRHPFRYQCRPEVTRLVLKAK